MDSVTDEILLIIFGFLQTDDIIRIGLVNKRFHRISSDPAINRFLVYENNLHLSSTILHQKACAYANRLQSLTFKDCFWIPSYQIVAALQRCTQLQELILTGSRLSLTGFVKIAKNNPNLKRFGWSIPNTNISSELQKLDGHTHLFYEIQSIFKRLKGILLRFESLVSFEQFMPIFDTKEIYVDEFGLEYLSERTSSYFTIGNTYGMHIKCKQKFEICLSDAIDSNRFLHFNLLVMDFVIQAVTKAALTNDVIVLLAPGNINSPCWKYITPVLKSVAFERIDMSYCMLAKDQMTWLSQLKKLTHLNLSDVAFFKANLMRVIATNCVNLQSLNLCHCEDWIEKDLHALDVLATNCVRLTELNLTCLHIHASDPHLNKLCAAVAKMNKLKSLALPACTLVNNVAHNSSSKPSTALSKWGTQSYKPQIVSNLVLFEDSCSTSTERTEIGARKLRSSQEDENSSSLISCGLEVIASSCKDLKELEIIDTGFHSAFSKLSTKQDQYFCPTTAHLRDKHFLPITHLTNLIKLTLAGLSGVASFTSLCEITKSCNSIEFLSIAHCGLSGHSGALSSLKQAVLNCRKLRRFRLDQPHLVLREQILEAFHSCKQLEVLCIISKNGKCSKDENEYLKVFQQCPKLAAFFLFSGLTISESKKIQSTLTKRYGKERPSLCATILPYFNALTEEGLSQVPYVYLRDVIRFESRVATCKYNA